MTLSEFENEIRKLNPEFQVMRAKQDSLTAAVLFKGVYQFAIPANGLYKDKNDSYGFEHPTSGNFLRHRTIGEAMAMAKHIVAGMNKGSEDYRAQMGLGEFSEAEMKKDFYPYSNKIIS
jgi:hypothetical protein